ncbi:MAG TPA: hypothetical protein VM573_02080 [Actinomycetota bacterium]|nr:hypothetical protein [Actinomycetota bacterium]
MTKHRRARVVAIVALALAAGSLPLAPRAGAACAPITVEGEWTTVAAPSFSDGPATIAAFDVVSTQPQNMFLTNGRVVMRTSDGGCTWTEVFRIEVLPDLDIPVSALNARITRIEIPDRSASRIVLLIAEEVGPVVRPHVAVSDDGGDSWEGGDAGLPVATGGNLRLHGAPSDPDVLYLMARQNPVAGGISLFRSTNGGRTWEERSEADFSAADFLIDPLFPDDLWLFGASGVARSLDGGANVIPTAITGVTPLATLVHKPGAPPIFMGYDPDGGTMVITPNGQIVDRIGAPPNIVLSMATGGSPEDIVASVHRGFFRFVPPYYWVNIGRDDQHERENILDLVVDDSAQPSVFGRTATTIERYRGISTVIDLDSFDLTDPDLRRSLPSLTPVDRKIRLKPGETKSVPYDMRVPPEDVGLDVFFLVDTTVSMQSSINGLRKGMQRIADRLAASGIDVQFGVGDYKEYPIPGYGDPGQGDYPYRLQAKIAPVGTALEGALEALEARGGGDIPESTLTALQQAATGEGEPPFVPAGQDAGFRPGALKVIINITDAPFHNSAAHPSPDMAAVIETLREKEILQIGLGVYGPNGAGGLSHLKQVAEGTDALAPPGGVDCDGDGDDDLGEGEPLVCRIDSYSTDVANLGPPIIATLEALRKDVPVRLEVSGAGDLLGEVTATTDRVNVLAPDRVRFDVEFTCPRSFVRETADVELTGFAAGSEIAGARARVVCLPAEREKVEPPPLAATPAAPVAPLAAIVLVPPAPPAPIVEHIPGAQSNPAAQTGFASQEEEQLQVATAVQRGVPEPDTEEQLAFTAYTARRKDPAPAPAFIGAAAAMFLAAAYLQAARQSARPSFVRRRSR